MIRLANIQAHVGGRLRLDVRGPNLELRRSTGWFPNILTNFFLDGLGAATASLQCKQYVHVGTGSSTPAATDTTLAQWVAGSAIKVGSGTNTDSIAGSPYYTGFITHARLNPGFGGGNVNISEVGWNNAAGNTGMYTRALVLDEFQQPTSISVLSDEYLDVIYEQRLYADENVYTGQIVLDGVTYDYEMKACRLTYSNGLNTVREGWFDQVNLTGFTGMIATCNAGSAVYPGPIGATIADLPSGTQTAVPNSSGSSLTATYAGAGTFQVNCTAVIGPQHGNIVAGIGVVTTRCGPYGIQIGFTPKIPKTSAQVLTLNWSFTYARKTI